MGMKLANRSNNSMRSNSWTVYWTILMMGLQLYLKRISKVPVQEVGVGLPQIVTIADDG
jgi:hypothetical protein